MARRRFNFKNGDVFAVPIDDTGDGRHFFGRVLLNVRPPYRRKEFPPACPLTFFGSSALVEVYALSGKISDFCDAPVLIPGKFVLADEIGLAWPIIANVPVDPLTVDFPEFVSGFRHPTGDAEFTCGEIQVPLPIEEEETCRLNVYPATSSPGMFYNFCLHHLGFPLDSDISPDAPRLKMSKLDLRFSEHRARIYCMLPFRMRDSYFQKQKQMGHSLERFYA